METVTTSYLTRAEYWVFATLLVYFLMNGAQVFETLVFVPKWTSSAPSAFNLLVDGKGASLKTFWIVLHSIHEIIFITAIVFTWRIPGIRMWMIILFTAHFAVRVWTIAYFAPNIIEFQKIATGSSSFTIDVSDKVSLWQKLNYARVAIFVAVSLAMIPVYQMLLQLRTK